MLHTSRLSSKSKTFILKEVAIILPTYNEADSIPKLLDRLMVIVEKLKISFEIIIVDDNSPDGTAGVIRRYQKKYSQVKLIVRTKDRGLGLSLLEGVRKSHSRVVIGMDADGNHNPTDIPKLLAKLQEADCVIASRFVAGGGMQEGWRSFPTLIFNLLLRFGFGFPCSDNASGFYAIKRDVLFSLPIKKIYYGYGDYHLRLVYFLSKRGYQIQEIPTYYKSRIAGQSKSHLLNMAILYIKEAWRLRISEYV